MYVKSIQVSHGNFKFVVHFHKHVTIYSNGLPEAAKFDYVTYIHPATVYIFPAYTPIHFRGVTLVDYYMNGRERASLFPSGKLETATQRIAICTKLDPGERKEGLLAGRAFLTRGQFDED